MTQSDYIIENIRWQKKIAEFNKQVRDFKDMVRSEIHRLDIDDTPEMQKYNCYMAEKMERFLDLHINTPEQLEYNKWLFNNGELRTEVEIALRNKEIENRIYVESGGLERDNASLTYGLSIGGFILGFIIPTACMADEGIVIEVIFGLPLGFILGSLFGLIGSCIAHHSNASVSKRYGAESIARQEEIKRNINTALTAGSVALIGRNIRKTAKDIANVDGWKQMK